LFVFRFQRAKAARCVSVITGKLVGIERGTIVVMDSTMDSMRLHTLPALLSGLIVLVRRSRIAVAFPCTQCRPGINYCDTNAYYASNDRSDNCRCSGGVFAPLVKEPVHRSASCNFPWMMADLILGVMPVSDHYCPV